MEFLRLAWTLALATLTTQGDAVAQTTAHRVGQLGESAAVTALAVSPDGRTVAVGRGDGTVSLFPYLMRMPEAGAPKKLDLQLERAVPVAFSPDLRQLAAFAQREVNGHWRPDRVQIWGLETGDLQHTMALTPRSGTEPLPIEAAFAPGGDVLAVAVGEFYHGSIELFDVREAKSLGRLERMPPEGGGMTNGVTWVAFSPDGNTIAANDYVVVDDKNMRPRVGLWDRHTRAWRSSVHTGEDQHPTRPRFAFSPTGDYFAVKNREDIAIVKLSSGELLRTIHPAKTTPDPEKRPGYGYWAEEKSAILFSPDARLLVSCTGGVVEIWEVPSGKRVCSLPTSLPATEVAFFPDGKMLACGYINGTVQFWRWGQ